MEAELINRKSELDAIRKLQQCGMFCPMRTATECRRMVGAEWFRDAVAKKKIVGVRHGKRVKYDIGRLLSIQMAELKQAERQLELIRI